MVAKSKQEDRIKQPNKDGNTEGLNHIRLCRSGGQKISALTTLALVFAASASVAPMRLATRVEAATETGNGIWNVRAVKVLKIL